MIRRTSRRSRTRRLGVGTLALALLVSLAAAGIAAPAATKDVPLFQYVFDVRSVTLTGTYWTSGGTATTRIHLAKPTKKISMIWFGKLGGGLRNGVGGAGISLVGEAVFKSPSDPSCNQTLKVASRATSVFLSLGGARDPVVTRPTIYADVENIPMAFGYGAHDGVPCKVQVLQGMVDNAHHTFPLAVLAKKSFTMSVRHPKEDLGDGESIAWSLQMTVRGYSYRPYKCAAGDYGCDYPK